MFSDQIQHCEEVSSLVKLADEYERQLKMVGIDLSDMPDDCSSLLNQYADVKMKTHLHDLDPSFLDEYYCTKLKEFIEHKHSKTKLENDIKALEEEIEQEKQTSKSLEDFIESIKTKIVSEDEMERTKFMVEKQIEILKSKNEKLFTHSNDIDLDQLMAKIATLETKKKQPK